MTTRAKRAIKRFIIRIQMWIVLGCIALFALIIGALVIAVPQLTNTQQAIITVVIGLALVIVQLADLLKSDDTEK